MGKGISGGRISSVTMQTLHLVCRLIIAGNTVMYGAIGSEAFFNGVAGERASACVTPVVPPWWKALASTVVNT